MSEATTEPTLWEPPSATQEVVTRQKALANQLWTAFTRGHGFTAALTDWTTSHTDMGEPVLSARVTGPSAEVAMKAFTVDGRIRFPGSAVDSGVRPYVDYDAPGRVQCVWRHDGVWVQLWRPDGTQPTPGIIAALTAPHARRTLRQRLSPSGRLTYTRTAKGNRTS